ncbi:MAG: RNA methyltransferase [Planctomycetota bacterium]
MQTDSGALAGRTIRVSSIDDPRLDVYRNQKDAWLRAQRIGGTGLDTTLETPLGTGLFMAEGELVVRQLVRAVALGRGWRVRSVLISENRLGPMSQGEHALSQLPPSVPIYLGDGDTLSAIVGFDLHRGVLVCGERPMPDQAWSLDRLIAQRRAIVVLEDLANHDNMGGLFRNAGALIGAEHAGVLLSPRSCDPLYRKALRVSIGQALHVPHAVAGDWPGDLERLANAGFETLALTPAPDAVDIDEIEPIGPTDHDRRLAIVLGAEGPGLTNAAMDACQRRVRIPVRLEADSLNVATAGAIAMHRLWSLRG